MSQDSLKLSPDIVRPLGARSDSFRAKRPAGHPKGCHMETLAFLIFCLGIGYVIVWNIVNERHNNADGDWGLLGIRKPRPAPVDPRARVPGDERP